MSVPAGGKYLIVNADDFGQSPGVNRGIIEAFERGIVSSTSLMVRWPDAAEAAGYGRAHPKLSVGLHVDFGEWAYRKGDWVRLYEVVSAEDSKAVTAEIAAQLNRFRELMGTDPTHIDSHQHVHRSDPIRSALVEVVERLGIPLRDATQDLRYCGDFYGQTDTGESLNNISSTTLIGILSNLKAGFTELGCHPAAQNDLDTMYGRERQEELTVLCDRSVRSSMEKAGIHLCSFHDFRRLRQQ